MLLLSGLNIEAARIRQDLTLQHGAQPSGTSKSEVLAKSLIQCCLPMQGMRQDLTVQHMGGRIAVDIYEAAARAALEHGDLPEYHQCQARLDTLHAQGVGGCRTEFLAYRILYQVAHSAQAGGAAALLSTLRLVDAQVRRLHLLAAGCRLLALVSPGALAAALAAASSACPSCSTGRWTPG